MLCWASSSIIHHPPPPLHQQRCLSLCGAVLCWCCAQPSLPPSAARLLSSRLVWFGLVSSWFPLACCPFGLDAPQGSVWFRRFGVCGRVLFCKKSKLYGWNIMA
ncbi:hypothetical protein J3E69DRAFT_178939 [Trichoderma sp. SZMC 28015]